MDLPLGPGDIVYPKDLLIPALQEGAIAGVAGIIVGGTSGIIRGSAPVLFAGAAGAQWFALGSTFWATRTLILQRDGVQNWFRHLRGTPLQMCRDLTTTRERTTASTAAGGITGGLVAALTRGRTNVVPGVIMFSLFGFGGQQLYDFLDSTGRKQEQENVPQPEGSKPANALQWISSFKFSPMKSLSDDEYRKLLDDKRLSLEAEIALIDEAIQKIRNESQGQEKR